MWSVEGKQGRKRFTQYHMGKQTPDNADQNISTYKTTIRQKIDREEQHEIDHQLEEGE